MVAQARVIISTAGPFWKHGGPVVDACVRIGCDYVDINGETPWVKKIIDLYHEEATKKEVRPSLAIPQRVPCSVAPGDRCDAADPVRLFVNQSRAP